MRRFFYDIARPEIFLQSAVKEMTHGAAQSVD